MVFSLGSAEAAIQRGDYGQCLKFLEPLAKKFPASQEEGSKVRMLMITALMGQGEEKKAISICRLLTQCKDPDIRQQSKQLLSILEAPSLQRPRNWSIELPRVELTTFEGKSLNKPSQARKNLKKIPPPPPTGATKGLGLGFSTFVFIVLSMLTILLSSCHSIIAR